MLGLIKDEKTNDSPFWLVSTRTSALMFYWLFFLIDLTRQKTGWHVCSFKNWSLINECFHLLNAKHTSEANRLTMKDAEYLHPLTQDEKTTVRLPTDGPILPYLSTSAYLIYMQLCLRNKLNLIPYHQTVSHIYSNLLASNKHLYDDYTKLLALFEHNEI